MKKTWNRLLALSLCVVMAALCVPQALAEEQEIEETICEEVTTYGPVATEGDNFLHAWSFGYEEAELPYYEIATEAPPDYLDFADTDAPFTLMHLVDVMEQDNFYIVYYGDLSDRDVTVELTGPDGYADSLTLTATRTGGGLDGLALDTPYQVRILEENGRTFQGEVTLLPGERLTADFTDADGAEVVGYTVEQGNAQTPLPGRTFMALTSDGKYVNANKKVITSLFDAIREAHRYAEQYRVPTKVTLDDWKAVWYSNTASYPTFQYEKNWDSSLRQRLKRSASNILLPIQLTSKLPIISPT